MSFQQLKIAPETMADLYKGQLVILEGVEKKEVSALSKPIDRIEEAASIRFLGNNKQKVGILVNFPEDVFLPDKHLQFLTKILEACKMNLGDVAILNHATQKVGITELRPLWQPSALLLFGITPEEFGLPINFPEFKSQAYDGVIYFTFPPLEVLNQDSENGKILKSKLWVCLKKLFNI